MVRDETIEDNDLLDLELAAQSNRFNAYYKESNLDDFISTDDNLVTSEPLPEYMLECENQADQEEEVIEPETETEIEPIPVKRFDASKAIDLLKL